MDTQVNSESIWATEDEYHLNAQALNDRVEELRAEDMDKDFSCQALNREEQSKRIDARAMLMDQFGIDSAFVRIPVLAKVLNLAPAGIYAAIREDRFFMPHRMMFSVPAVKLDDLVEWYCRDETSAQSTTKRRSDGASQGTASENKPCVQPIEVGTVDEAAACAASKSSKTSIGLFTNQDVDSSESDAERLKREKLAIIKSVRERMKAR